MEDFSNSLDDIETPFEKSLKELRRFRSQIYHAADYCETTFVNAENKRMVLDTTKEYILQAVITIVDRIGNTSANLECCLLKYDSCPETEYRIDNLKLRIMTFQQHAHKLALARFYWAADFSRYHSRYILPPPKNSATIGAVSRNTKAGLKGKKNQFETDEPLFIHTYNCKPTLVVESSTKNKEDYLNELSPSVIPVSDGLAIIPKVEHSSFQFQDAQKLKRSKHWKLTQSKDVASLIRRGKRILA